MMYSRAERPLVNTDERYERRFSLPLDQQANEKPRAKEQSTLANEVGLIATIVVATGGFLALLTYVGMFGP